MTILALTFDLDDTLWPVKPALLRAEKETLAWLREHASQITDRYSPEEMLEVRLSLLEAHPALAHQVSELRKRALSKMALEAGYTHDTAEKIAQAGFEIFLQHRQQVDCFPGVKQLLAELAKSYIVGAISNGNADVFKTSIATHFNFSVSAETAGAAKPDPAIFAHALEQVSAVHMKACKPSQIIHIGDDYDSDIVGGKSFGYRTVWIRKKGLAKADKDVSKRADIILEDILELPAAIKELSESG